MPARRNPTPTPTPTQLRIAAAHEAHQHNAAVRALDDPVKVARATRIVRLAVARELISLDDLTASDAK